MEESDKQRKNPMNWLRNHKEIVLAIALAVVIVAAGGFAVMEKASANPAFCVTCHVMKPYYDVWHNSNLLANVHAKAGVTCDDCHKYTLSSKIKDGVDYVTGNYTVPLQPINVSKDLCLKCHNYDQVKAKTNFTGSSEGTVNPHDSHNGLLECTKCHSMHSQSKIYCAQCHQFDFFSKLDSSWKTD